jgi:ferredoxin--NADP+ reductase
VHDAQGLTHQGILQHFEQHYHGRFHYLPIVTREKVRQIYSERITLGIETGEIERLVQIPLTVESSQVMLCGNPSMIKEITHILQQRGLTINRHKTPGNITLENYWK